MIDNKMIIYCGEFNRLIAFEICKDMDFEYDYDLNKWISFVDEIKSPIDMLIDYFNDGLELHKDHEFRNQQSLLKYFSTIFETKIDNNIQLSELLYENDYKICITNYDTYITTDSGSFSLYLNIDYVIIIV